MQQNPKQRPPAYEPKNFNADQLGKYIGTGFEGSRLKLLFESARAPTHYRHSLVEEARTCSVDVALLPEYSDQDLGSLGLSAKDIARARKIASELPVMALTAESTL